MLKFKKIIRSCVCFLVLLAFAGTISLELIPGRTKNTGVEVSVLNIQGSIHFMALSEENDSDETFNSWTDVMELPAFNHSTLNFNKTLLQLSFTFFTNRFLSLPLYLNYRCLRL